ncbi:MAG: group 1 glycosyl transferase, partial [bacterium]|nr:group 1 glycosyl transferase [bacterium]
MRREPALQEPALRGPAPLRILMVLESTFIARGGGGAESQLRTLAVHLRQLGQRVTVVTPLLPWGSSITCERWSGIPVGRISYPRWKWIGSIILWLRFAAFLWKRRNRYDAWHVHIGHHLGAITCLIGALVKKPVVVKVSGWWELENGLLAPGGGLFRRLQRRWLRRATAVQAISTRIAAALIKLGFPPERIVVLPNAVDTSRFHTGAAALIAGKPFVAVYVGRFVPEKDVDVLLDSWAAAFAGRSDVRLRLVGNGILEEPLRQQAARLGIAEQVEFLGPRDRVEEELA